MLPLAHYYDLFTRYMTEFARINYDSEQVYTLGWFDKDGHPHSEVVTGLPAAAERAVALADEAGDYRCRAYLPRDDGALYPFWHASGGSLGSGVIKIRAWGATSRRPIPADERHPVPLAAPHTPTTAASTSIASEEEKNLSVEGQYIVSFRFSPDDEPIFRIIKGLPLAVEAARRITAKYRCASTVIGFHRAGKMSTAMRLLVLAPHPLAPTVRTIAPNRSALTGPHARALQRFMDSFSIPTPPDSEGHADCRIVDKSLYETANGQ
jgi:hypothetical protein